jgi:hypothetical protein
MYVDVHPDILEQYHGVEGEVIPFGVQSGAGHPADEGRPERPTIPEASDSENDEDDLLQGVARNIADTQQENLRHAAIKPARHTNPFQTHLAESNFREALLMVQAQDAVSQGYRVLPEEWEGGSYPDHEILHIGRGRKKELRVVLPEEVWWPCAKMWAQGLEVLTQVVMMNRGKL